MADKEIVDALVKLCEVDRADLIACVSSMLENLTEIANVLDIDDWDDLGDEAQALQAERDGALGHSESLGRLTGISVEDWKKEQPRYDLMSPTAFVRMLCLRQPLSPLRGNK